MSTFNAGPSPLTSYTVPLLVENVEPIIWNKAAFENLAAPDDTKMLITALITNKIKSTESMDFVQGKGTGLIVLLHGYDIHLR